MFENEKPVYIKANVAHFVLFIERSRHLLQLCYFLGVAPPILVTYCIALWEIVSISNRTHAWHSGD